MVSRARQGGRYGRLLLALTAASLMLAACGGSETTSDPETTDTGSVAATDVAAGAETTSATDPPDVDSIKIAAPFGLTGPVGPFAEPYIPALELAIDKINEAGGIESLGGAQLELLLQDSQSDPETAIRLLREMKNEGAVVALAPFASGLALAAKPVLEELDMPVILPSFAAGITDDNEGQVIWRIVKPDAAITEDGMDFVVEARDAGDIEVDSIGIVAISGGAGPPFADAVVARAEQEGIETVNVAYDPAETQDFGPIVAQLRDADVDLVTGFQYAQDAILFAEALLLQEWRPSEGFVWLGGAHGEYAFREAFGQETAGWMDVGFGSPTGCPEMEDFAAEYEESYGEPLIGLMPAAPASIAVLADALERAGSTESDALKAALADTSIGYCEHPLYALAGSVDFNERGDNMGFQSTVVQHEGELELVPVHPEGVAVRPPAWPALAE